MNRVYIRILFENVALASGHEKKLAGTFSCGYCWESLEDKLKMPVGEQDIKS